LSVLHVDHTGEPTWQQRAWAGVLFCAPAALSHQSAIRAAAGPRWRHGDDDPIHVAVDWGRTRVSPPGYQIHRTRGLPERVLGSTGPPRIRLEDAVLDVAAECRSELQTIAPLADICQTRRTTAARLLVRLDDRARLRQRPLLTAVLRDVDYEDYRFIVELDGRLFHDSTGQRDRDMDRDLALAVDGRDSVRLSYGQVLVRACRTAAAIGLLLQRRGWAGLPRPCGPNCRMEPTSWSLRRT
jgi:very-short-patch-repair endonuclease